MPFRSCLKSFFILSLLCLTLALRVSAQADTGTISGVVTDPTGATVSGAIVDLQSLDRGSSVTTKSNSSGIYLFASVQPGKYRLAVRASGFRQVDLLNLIVNTQDHIEQNFQLQIGSASESVTVESEAPLLNTTDASLGHSFETRQVEQLPIEARNVVELLSLQPGVTFLGKQVNANSDTRSGSVNGARSDQSNVTLDGVDVNDQVKGFAFTSVLRNTQDSVQEFRVATSNANADAGRSSGAQVSLVTKSGTNAFHGSAYEYNRNSAFTANDYFNKRTQLVNGKPDARPQLIRNIFGGSAGGPVKRDKLFFFANYEGRRDREGVEVLRKVPTQSYRQGTLTYYVNNSSGNVVTTTLTPDNLKTMDPLGIGENAAVLGLLQQYPLPNDPTQGDRVNQQGFRFVANEARKFDTYIAKLDYKITSDGRHTIFWRGTLQNDNAGGAPQFPGQPAATRTLDNSKGFALGYTAVLDPTKVNSFRWGFTRQGGENAGASTSPQVSIAAIDTLIPFTRSSSFKVPVHNFVDDFFWSKGKHSFQLGTNLRLVWDDLSGLTNSFSSASMTTGYLKYQGFAGKSTTGNVVPFDPGPAGFTPVAGGHGNQYDNAVMGLVGLISEATAVYNYDKTGSAVPLGRPITRNFRWNEYDFYAQDSWLIRSNLTLTYGLRWSLLEPPYERNGEQVGPCILSGTSCTPYSLGDWFQASAQQGSIGGAANATPEISFAPNGRANGRPGLWDWDRKNFAPRIAVAWSPNFQGGLLRSLFGGSKQTSIRVGYALVYDHFGSATINEYNSDGSYGMTSKVQNVAGTVTAANAPRFTGFTNLPSTLLPPPAPGGFPATPSPDAFAISWGMDAGMKTPYAHTYNLSVTRELTNNTAFTVAYVGRLGRRLPVQEDVAMPLNLIDPKSHTDYFAAAAALSKLAYANAPVSSVQPMPYWENMFAALTGTDLGSGPLTATQVVYSVFQQNLANETNALFELDLPDSQSGAGLNVPGHNYPSYRFYHDQYSALYAWRTIGTSDYHGLQLSLHHRFGLGLQGDFNYTFSKSMDWTSQAERIPTSGGNNNAQIINTWAPNQLRGVSDYDTRHQINANWIYELPFGKKRRFASSANRGLDTLIGGWQLSGLYRWTSGFPMAVSDGDNWPTNWDISGYATLQSQPASAALGHTSGPQAFGDPQAVLAAFRFALPGESGTRNPLRGDGYFSLDAGLAKSFPVTESVNFRLRWDVFNVTNSVRFNSISMSNRIDNPNTFGVYSSTLTDKRVMQIALRLEF